jgi:hypothetical protein
MSNKGLAMKLHYYVIIYTVILFDLHPVNATETEKKVINSRSVIKTGKERLGKKAADNQRVNNCKVPIEKRGTKIRTAKCVRR